MKPRTPLNRTIVLLLSVVLLSTAFTGTTVNAFAEEKTDTYYFIAGDRVRIHSEPSGSSKVIAKLNYGYVLGGEVKESGGWTSFNYKGRIAYVATQFVQSSDFSRCFYIGTTKKNVSVYSLPSTKGKKLTTLKKNSLFKIIEKGDHLPWVKIVYNINSIGFIQTNAITPIQVQEGMVVLGTASISYSHADSNARQNIAQAVQRLNHSIIPKGKRFSLLSIIGRDYRQAEEINGTKAVSGGGLSHLATTFKKAINSAQHTGYNLAIKAETIPRGNNPYGKNSESCCVTITPKRDFVVKNNTGYNITILAKFEGNTVKIALVYKIV